MNGLLSILGQLMPGGLLYPQAAGWRRTAEDPPRVKMFSLVLEEGRWEVCWTDEDGAWHVHEDEEDDEVLDHVPDWWHPLPEPPPPPSEDPQIERALREALAGLFDDGWSPPTTAPAEGALVLFILTDHSKAVLRREASGWVDQDGDPVDASYLTAWHVLPEPPPTTERTNVVPLRRRTP